MKLPAHLDASSEGWRGLPPCLPVRGSILATRPPIPSQQLVSAAGSPPIRSHRL